MNITKNILLMAAIISLLMMGAGIIPMQSYAGLDNNDNKPKTSASSQTDKKSANQHMGQDNFCYSGNETCTQANGGQEITGKHNDEFGFNDQSTNIQ